MVVDPEEEFFQDEIAKLRNDVQHNGLSLMVLADWYVGVYHTIVDSNLCTRSLVYLMWHVNYLLK